MYQSITPAHTCISYSKLYSNKVGSKTLPTPQKDYLIKVNKSKSPLNEIGFNYDPIISPEQSWRDKKSVWVAAVAVVSLCWGLNFPVTKLVTDASTRALTIPPGAFVALRFGLAGMAFSPMIFRADDMKRTLLGGAEVGLYLAFGYVSQSIGLVTEDAGEVSEGKERRTEGWSEAIAAYHPPI